MGRENSLELGWSLISTQTRYENATFESKASNMQKCHFIYLWSAETLKNKHFNTDFPIMFSLLFYTSKSLSKALSF